MKKTSCLFLIPQSVGSFLRLHPPTLPSMALAISFVPRGGDAWQRIDLDTLENILIHHIIVRLYHLLFGQLMVGSQYVEIR